MKATKNRGGRPRLAPMRAGEKTSLSIRISPDVRKEIEKACAKSGRSISQEAEIRLICSFRDEDVMAELRAVRALLARYIANNGAVGR